MGLFEWFRRRRKKRIDQETEMLERTGKLQTEIVEQVKEKPRRTKKQESI